MNGGLVAVYFLFFHRRKLAFPASATCLKEWYFHLKASPRRLFAWASKNENMSGTLIEGYLHLYNKLSYARVLIGSHL